MCKGKTNTCYFFLLFFYAPSPNAVVVLWNAKSKSGNLLIGLFIEVVLCVVLDIFEIDSHILVSVRAALDVVCNPAQ